MVVVPLTAPRSTGAVASPNVTCTFWMVVLLPGAGDAPIANVVGMPATGLPVTDTVTLGAPDGKPVHRVAWGKASEAKPAPGTAETDKPLLDETAPVVSKSSVQRDGPAAGGAFRAHIDLPGFGDTPFSPGQFRVLLPCPVVPAPPFTGPGSDKPK